MRTTLLAFSTAFVWCFTTACSTSSTTREAADSGGSTSSGGRAPAGASGSAATGGVVSSAGGGAGGRASDSSGGASPSAGGVGANPGGAGGTVLSGGTGGASAGAGGAQVCMTSVQDPVPSLAESYAHYFPIGVAIDSQYMKYATTVKKHFRSVTMENEMKFDALQRVEGNFTFSTADQMVDFALQNGMAVRGHALVWHNQTPDWVFSGTKEQVLARMQKHISTVMKHYQGKVKTWDVVNEAINDDGSLRGTNGGSGWYKALGESYIAEAFRAARQADPTAKLFYNDYAHYAPARRQGIYALLSRLIQDGVPIDGVGLQGHMHLAPGANHDVIRYQTVAEEETAINLYASLGLDVQITEFDVSLYVLGDKYDTTYTPATVTPELLAKQAARYNEFFALFRKHKDVISSVTIWGISDDNTWLSEITPGQQDFPLLFDAQQRPKPAFWAVASFCP